MTKKMTGKGVQGGVTDISSFIEAADTLPEAKNSPVGRPKVKKAPSVGRGVGKPPMASGEVRSKTIQVTLTEAEHAALKTRADKVPLSTYLRDELKSKGIV